MKQPLPRDTLKLFIKFQNNFDNYVHNQKEKESLFNISGNLLILLHEIVQSNTITNLLIRNTIIRQETRQKRKQNTESNDNKTLEKEKDKHKEKDIIKDQRSKNSSSFNQRSIQTINHFYHSINELIIIKEIICDTAFNIAKSSIEEAIEMKYGKINKGSHFILRKKLIQDDNICNSNKKEKKKPQKEIEDGWNQRPDIPRRFISLNEYIRKGKLGLKMSQYDLLMKHSLKSSLINNSQNLTKKHLATEPNNNSKGYLPSISLLVNNLQQKEETIKKLSSPYKTTINFNQFPMEANMNIKGRLDKRVAVIKKNNLSLKQRDMLYTSAFDYEKIFIISNANGNNNHKISKSTVNKRVLIVNN